MGAHSRSRNPGAPQATKGGYSPPRGGSATQACSPSALASRSVGTRLSSGLAGPSRSPNPDVSPRRLGGTAATAAVGSGGRGAHRRGHERGHLTRSGRRRGRLRAGVSGPSEPSGRPGKPAPRLPPQAHAEAPGGPRAPVDPRPPTRSPRSPGKLTAGGGLCSGPRTPRYIPRCWKRPLAERPESSAPSPRRKGRATARRHLRGSVTVLTGAPPPWPQRGPITGRLLSPAPSGTRPSIWPRSLQPDNLSSVPITGPLPRPRLPIAGPRPS